MPSLATLSTESAWRCCFLLGENLFQRKLTSSTNTKRLAVAGLLILLVPLGGQIAALLLAAIVTALLAALAAWEWVK